MATTRGWSAKATILLPIVRRSLGRGIGMNAHGGQQVVFARPIAARPGSTRRKRPTQSIVSTPAAAHRAITSPRSASKLRLIEMGVGVNKHNDKITKCEDPNSDLRISCFAISVLQSLILRHFPEYIQVSLGVAEDFLGQGVQGRLALELGGTVLDRAQRRAPDSDHLAEKEIQGEIVLGGELGGKRPGLGRPPRWPIASATRCA